MDAKTLADAVQRWSGVGTFVVAAVAVVAYMATLEDRALDAEFASVDERFKSVDRHLTSISGQLDSIDKKLDRLDARSIKHLERLAKLEEGTKVKFENIDHRLGRLDTAVLTFATATTDRFDTLEGKL